jgi:hypothetical protein
MVARADADADRSGGQGSQAMSVTGYWIAGAIPPAAVEKLRDRFTPLPPAEPDEDLSWWRAMDEATIAEPESLHRGPHCPTDAVARFTEMIGARVPAADDDINACIDAVAEVDEEDDFVVSVRKGDPVAALFYGLGFAAARTLPGRFGCFLLTADEVLAAVPAAHSFLSMDAFRRAQVLARIYAWLEVAGDVSADFDANGLIDGIPRILLRAAELGRGAVGVVQWY